MLTPVLVAPGTAEVLALEAECSTPQAGHATHDGAQEAATRWGQRQAPLVPCTNVTVRGDALFCHPPCCALRGEHPGPFILGCKRESHATVYGGLAVLATAERRGVVRERHGNGKFGEIWTSR